MQLTINQLSTDDLFNVMMRDGVIVLPTKLGYAMASITPSGCQKMYHLKNRPESKPSGVLGTSRIFRNITRSNHCSQIEQIPYPLGVIEEVNQDAVHVRNLPDFGVGENKIGVFINLDVLLTDLAELAYEHGKLVVVTSANKAGEGNCYRLEDIAEDILERADVAIDGGLCEYKAERGHFENITTTMVDLTEKRFARPGAFEEMILEDTAALGLIDPDEMNRVRGEKKQTTFRSALFLRTFEESTYAKLARAKKADWIVLDFEDGCPDDMKMEARTLAQKHLNEGDFDQRPVAIRLNNLLHKDELEKDMEMDFGDKVTAFITPMLNSLEDFARFVDLVEQAEERQGLVKGFYRLIPLIETAKAMTIIDEIASASERNVAMILGHADFFGSTKAGKTLENLHWIRMKFVMACRTHDLKAFDTPFENVRDIRGFHIDCKQGRDVGMDGKIVLHFDQVDHVNRTFGIQRAMRDRLRSEIAEFNGGCTIKDGKFIGAPIIHQMQNDLSRTLHISRTHMNRGPIGKRVKYGLDVNQKVGLGQVIVSAQDVTVDDAWIAMWHGLIPTINPLETSTPYCRELGLRERLIPSQLLVNLALCMLVEPYSESSVVHLSVEDVEYERAAFAGDTFRTVMMVDQVRHTSDGRNSIVQSKVIMLNQLSERIISFTRRSFFTRLTLDPKFEMGGTEAAFGEYFEETQVVELRQNILKQAARVSQRQWGEQLAVKRGELILHDLVRPVGESAGMIYSTLTKNTHAIHFNELRHQSNIAVSGGFVLPLVLGIAQRDFKYVLHERVVRTAHINPLNPQEHLGAMSLITKVEDQNGVEEVSVRTFGIREMDVPVEMDGIPVPIELCAADLGHRKHVEIICHKHIPELAGRISLVVDWKFWRNKPKA